MYETLMDKQSMEGTVSSLALRFDIAEEKLKNDLHELIQTMVSKGLIVVNQDS